MTTRLLILLAAALLCWAAPAQAQTIKSLGYNTTNGNIVYTGTNPMRFTSPVSFDGGPVLWADGIAYGASTNIVINFETQQWSVGNNVIFQYETNGVNFHVPLSFNSSTNAATTRTNLSLGLSALTNTSNVTMMRALAGSTNTNEPYSGTVALTNTNVLTFSNGVLLKIQ